MAVLREYSRVRVRQLLRPLSDYDGARINLRPPEIGDLGIVVDIDIQQAPGLPNRYVYVVESEAARSEGGPVWLGDFMAEELEALPEGQPQSSP